MDCEMHFLLCGTENWWIMSLIFYPAETNNSENLCATNEFSDLLSYLKDCWPQLLEPCIWSYFGSDDQY